MANKERSDNNVSQITRDRNNDILDEEAWQKLSVEFPWSEQLLEKYQDKVDWKAVSENDNMVWTASMLEKFRHFIDWDVLSRCGHQCILTAEMLERFKEYWNWSELSGNDRFDLDYELIDRFIDRWDWTALIDRYDESNLFNYEWNVTGLIFRRPHCGVRTCGAILSKSANGNWPGRSRYESDRAARRLKPSGYSRR